MTIKERKCNGGEKMGVNAVYVYCVHDDHARHPGGDNRTQLFYIHHGYGETQPISLKEYAKAIAVAMLHDQQTKGKHLLDVVLFTKND